jgi:hypothetical protein
MAESVWLGMEHLMIPKNGVMQILAPCMLPVAMFMTCHQVNVNCHHHTLHILCGNNLVILHYLRDITFMKVTYFSEILYNRTKCQDITLKMRLVLLPSHKFACLSC